MNKIAPAFHYMQEPETNWNKFKNNMIIIDYLLF